MRSLFWNNFWNDLSTKHLQELKLYFTVSNRFSFFFYWKYLRLMCKDSKSNGTFSYQVFQTNEAQSQSCHHTDGLHNPKWTINHQPSMGTGIQPVCTQTQAPTRRSANQHPPSPLDHAWPLQSPCRLVPEPSAARLVPSHLGKGVQAFLAAERPRTDAWSGCVGGRALKRNGKFWDDAYCLAASGEELGPRKLPTLDEALDAGDCILGALYSPGGSSPQGWGHQCLHSGHTGRRAQDPGFGEQLLGPIASVWPSRSGGYLKNLPFWGIQVMVTAGGGPRLRTTALEHGVSNRNDVIPHFSSIHF